MNPTKTHRRAILGLLNDIERAIQACVVAGEDAGHLLLKRKALKARLYEAKR